MLRHTRNLRDRSTHDPAARGGRLNRPPTTRRSPMHEPLRSRVGASVRRSGPSMLAAAHAASRLSFLARCRLAAALADAHLELDVSPDAVIAAGARVDVWPGSRSSVVIGPGATLGDRSLL